MEGNGRSVPLLGIAFVLLTFTFVAVEGKAPSATYADIEFTMISNLAEIGRHRDLYIYAINHIDGGSNDVEFSKDYGLPSNIAQTGPIAPFYGVYGCYMKVHEPNRQKGLRYGRYEGTWIERDPAVMRETFVKPPSKLLNTRTYTVTIYPMMFGETPLPEPISIGVGWSPGCNKIVWCKGRKNRVNIGPRLELTSTEDAGLYTIQRPGRGRRGWFVQIRVIAASCPQGRYLDESTDPDSCPLATTTCMNGGVLKDKEDSCVCPSFFGEDDCSMFVAALGNDHFVLAQVSPYDRENSLLCRDLPGGDPKCKGLLVCPGDNYGCKCSSGWWGNACDRPCQKGQYGPNCEVRCPDDERDCSRFFGPGVLDGA